MELDPDRVILVAGQQPPPNIFEIFESPAFAEYREATDKHTRIKHAANVVASLNLGLGVGCFTTALGWSGALVNGTIALSVLMLGLIIYRVRLARQMSEAVVRVVAEQWLRRVDEDEGD